MIRKTPLKIIIADDDYDDREMLTMLFSSNDYFDIVNCLKIGTDVLAEIITKANIPDVLLIDMYMPLLSGAEVVQKIVESKAAPLLYMFIISTSVNPVEQLKYKDNPRIKFLKKPISLSEINELPSIILQNVNRIEISSV